METFVWGRLASEAYGFWKSVRKLDKVEMIEMVVKAATVVPLSTDLMMDNYMMNTLIVGE